MTLQALASTLDHLLWPAGERTSEAVSLSDKIACVALGIIAGMCIYRYSDSAILGSVAVLAVTYLAGLFIRTFQKADTTKNDEGNLAGV